MPLGLERRQNTGQLHFITFSCYRRQPLLGTIAARDCFVVAIDEVRKFHPFLLIAYVVMPEHVHLVMSEPREGTPSTILQVLKQRVSRQMHKGAGTSDQPFWQRRFYDVNIWNEKKLQEKLDYIHANPVKRGLVEHPRDWVWSSWSHYFTGSQGLLRVDELGDFEQRRTPQDGCVVRVSES